MDCYESEVARLKEQFGDKTLGEMEEELGINRYNNVGVGFGYIGKGKLPETREEAMKIFDMSEISELVTGWRYNKEELGPKSKEFLAISSVEYNFQNTIKELDTAIAKYKEIHDFIETLYKKYLLEN